MSPFRKGRIFNNKLTFVPFHHFFTGTGHILEGNPADSEVIAILIPIKIMYLRRVNRSLASHKDSELYMIDTYVTYSS